jgi:hypothetical protein
MGHLMLASLFVCAAATAHADTPKSALAVGELFTVKSILGVSPSPDQVRLGESDVWSNAFGKCKAAFGVDQPKPPLRVGEPRMVKSKDKRTSGEVEITTMELDFQCGLPAKPATPAKKS